MKKRKESLMNKIIAGLLVFVISFSMLTPVYAADDEQVQNIDEVLQGEPEKDSIEDLDNVERINNVSNELGGTENEDNVDEIDAVDKTDTVDETDKSENDLDNEENVESPKEEIHYGWYYKKGSGWYYYNSKGIKQKGWLYKNNIWYYLDPSQDGVMLSDCCKVIDKKGYMFKKSGDMITGWG